MLAADRAGSGEFDELVSRVMSVAREGKSDEARELLMANQGIGVKLWDTFLEHRQYNAILGNKSEAEAVATKHTATLVGMLLAGW